MPRPNMKLIHIKEKQESAFEQHFKHGVMTYILFLDFTLVCSL